VPLALPVALVALLLRAGASQEEDVGSSSARGALPRAAYATVPRSGEIVDRQGECSEPALVPLGGERALLVWVAYEVGVGDRLAAAEVEPGKLGEPFVIQPTPTQILAPCGLVDQEGHAHLFWTEIVGGAPRLFTAVRDGEKFGAPQRIATPSGLGQHPSCARATDGALWLAWQAYAPPVEGRTRGSFDAFLGRLDGTSLADVLHVGEGRSADLDPVVVARDDGRLTVVFAQYRGLDYEIVARDRDPKSGELSPLVEVSAAPLCDDVHPAACAARGGGVWIAWDELTSPMRGSSRPRDRVTPGADVDADLRLVLLQGDGTIAQLEKPRLVDPEMTLLSWSGGLPRLAADLSGRPRVLFRWLDQQNDEQPGHAYPVMTELAAGASMSPPTLLDESDGDEEPAAICRVGSGFLVAWQADRRAAEHEQGLSDSLPAGLAKTLEPKGIFLTGYIGPSKLGVAFVADVPPPAPTDAPLALAPRMAPPPGRHVHALPDADVDPVLLGEQRLEVAADGKSYSVFWGDLHRHSCESRCMFGVESTADDRYAFGRDVGLCDFYALTDHSSQIDPHGWWKLLKRVDLHQTPEFCTLPGFEWSTTKYGHYNVVFRETTQRVVSSRLESALDPDGLWSHLVPGQALTIPHHSAHGRMGTDWSFKDDRFLRVVEIYQALRGSFEFDGCYRQSKSATAPGKFVQDALSSGIEFGLVASTDHGDGSSYAAVLAERLDRASLFDALAARRCYASTTKGMLVDLRVDGKLMGSTLSTSGIPELELGARGTSDLAEITVFRNGEVLRREGRTLGGGERASTTLELVWWPRGELDDWAFEVKVDRGRFGTPDTGEGARAIHMLQWTLVDERTVAWKQAEPSPFRSQVKRFVLKDGADARVHLTVMGKELDTTVKELVDEPLRGKHRATEWVFRVKQTLENPDLDFRAGDGRTFHDRFKDEQAPSGRSWYYARVVQHDGEVAWSSPIFVERP